MQSKYMDSFLSECMKVIFKNSKVSVVKIINLIIASKDSVKLPLNAAVLPVGPLLSQAGLRSRSPGRQRLREEPLEHSSVLDHAAAHTDVHKSKWKNFNIQLHKVHGVKSKVYVCTCGYSHCDEGRQHLQCVDVDDGQQQQLEVSVS